MSYSVEYLLKNTPLKNSTKLDLIILLAFVLQKTTTFLATFPKTTLSSTQYQSFQNLIKKRNLGVPVAYLIGEQEFWSLTFKVNRHTLIPRPDTEILVEHTLIQTQKNNYQTILDLGTGSGAIALSIGFEQPKLTITATDISPDALVIAQENQRNLNIKNVQFINSDWFDFLKKTPSIKFDCIVSNPPYIQSDDLHLSNLSFEPKIALTSGATGLNDIQKILQSAKNHLNSNGCLIIEHGFNQALQVQQLFKHHNFANIQTHQDYGKNDRITFGFV